VQLEAEQKEDYQKKDYCEAEFDKTKDRDKVLVLVCVQKGLGVLRDYCAGSAAASLVQDNSRFGSLMQQSGMPEKHGKSAGAGQGIIGILEVIESEFPSNLAKGVSQEADSQSEDGKTTQANKISKDTKEQDVKYKTQEFRGLDKGISELASDKITTATELSKEQKEAQSTKLKEEVATLTSSRHIWRRMMTRVILKSSCLTPDMQRYPSRCSLRYKRSPCAHAHMAVSVQ